MAEPLPIVKMTKKLLNIEVIETENNGHNDLLFEFSNLISKKIFDTYYFALSIEPKNGTTEIKNAISELIGSWNKKLSELKKEQIIYLPIDFSDQYTGCIKVEKKNDLKLTYGYSKREGWSVNPINPKDYYETITDFKTETEKALTVKQTEFEKCLTEIIKKLKTE